MNDETLQWLIFKMLNDPDSFTIMELDTLNIEMRRRALK
jgi:hypothetical protein